MALRRCFDPDRLREITMAGLPTRGISFCAVTELVFGSTNVVVMSTRHGEKVACSKKLAGAFLVGLVGCKRHKSLPIFVQTERNDKMALPNMAVLQRLFTIRALFIIYGLDSENRQG